MPYEPDEMEEDCLNIEDVLEVLEKSCDKETFGGLHDGNQCDDDGTTVSKEPLNALNVNADRYEICLLSITAQINVYSEPTYTYSYM